MRNSSSLDWLRFMHTPNDYRVSQYTSNSPTLHSIYNKIIYMKVRETRLLITIHNFEFCRIPGTGNK